MRWSCREKDGIRKKVIWRAKLCGRLYEKFILRGNLSETPNLRLKTAKLYSVFKLYSKLVLSRLHYNYDNKAVNNGKKYIIDY